MGSGRGRHTWGIVAAGRSLTSRGELRSHYAAGCVGNDYHKTTTARLSVTTKVGLPATLKARRVHCGFIVNMPRASGSGAGSRRANGCGDCVESSAYHSKNFCLVCFWVRSSCWFYSFTLYSCVSTNWC